MVDVFDCTKLLIKKLTKEGLIDKTANDFLLLTNNNIQKIKFANNLLKEHNLLPIYDEVKLTKCNKKAEEFKNLGNQLYRDKKFYEALVSYNKSLCYSPEDSQNIGIGFANRSAVYFAMGQYEKCLENIELAKNHNYPKEKIVKLNNREEQAIENLNNCPDPNQILIKYEAARERFLKSKLKGKENLNFFVADCLEVKTSPEFGRHLITNEDLKVGSVIVIEKPFSKIVEPGAIYETCGICLKRNLLNLLPCFNCCSSMFCSEDCRSAAQEKFHKYECGLVTAINGQFSKSSRLVLRTYLEALHICGTPSKLREFLNSIKDSNDTVLNFGYTDESSFRKNSLHAIDNLLTFEKSANCNDFDIFMLSNACAIFCHIMLNYSEALKALLVDVADQDFFREFIFKYTQISSINSHGLYCQKTKVHCVDQLTSNNNNDDQSGAAFFPFCALINHSCAPNIIRETFETNNYIIVARPIKKGEQIFDNYRFDFCSTSLEERQKGLLQQYRFKCSCEACKNDYPMLIDLKIRDKFLFKNLMKNYPRLLNQDLDVAVENFEKYCKYIDELDENDYPSHDATLLHDMISFCIHIFTKSESYEI